MYVIQYVLGKNPNDPKSRVFYSVERGDFGHLDDCTTFRVAADAKMVKLRLHEEKSISLKKLTVEPVPLPVYVEMERVG